MAGLSLIGKMGGWREVCHGAATLAQLAKEKAYWQRMSPIGTKAGDQI